MKIANSTPFDALERTKTGCFLTQLFAVLSERNIWLQITTVDPLDRFLDTRSSRLQTLCQFIAITPKSHCFMLGVGIVTEIKVDRPIVFFDPTFYQFTNRDGLARTNIYNTVIASSHRQGNKEFRDLGYGQVVAQLLATRHAECAVAPLYRSLELRQQ
jgi:hypothetical protein